MMPIFSVTGMGVEFVLEVTSPSSRTVGLWKTSAGGVQSAGGGIAHAGVHSPVPVVPQVVVQLTDSPGVQTLVSSVSPSQSSSTPLHMPRRAQVHAAMAKRFACDECYKVIDDSLQLFGGYGYLKDYPIERYLRDARVHRILEGSDNVMRIVTAHSLLGK